MRRIHAVSLVLFAFGLLAAVPPAASAGLYKVAVCTGSNDARGPVAATSTPNISTGDHCGAPDGDPPGGSAFLSVHENQPNGAMTNGAYGEFAWTAPASTHFRQAGGYTRQAFGSNAGWRTRFVGTNLDGSTFLSLNQGSDVADDGAVNRSSSPNFGPHIWPWAYLRDFRRFAFRLECVRAAGCDRTGLTEADANGFVFVLSDDFDSRIDVTNASTPFMAGTWTAGAARASWSVTEQGSGLRLMRVAVDGANDAVYDYAPFCDTQTTASNGMSGRALAPCAVNSGTYGAAWDINTAAYPDGERTLAICSQDFGQWQGYYGTGGETCDRRTIRIDNTAPVAPSNLSAGGRRGTFSASWVNPPQQGVAPIAVASYRLEQLSGGDFDSGVVRADGAAAQSLVARPAGTDGGYRLTVWLEDAAGNANPANLASQTFVIDSTTPETSITEGPAQGSATNSRSATFAYVSSDPTATFECALDGAAFTVCPGSGRSYSALPDGDHVFRVRAANANGPDPTPAERAWRVDNLAPTTTITSGPGPGAVVKPAAAIFRFVADESTVEFECSLDGAAFSGCSAPEAYPGLADGAHVFNVRARDGAGNLGAPASRSFTVDGTAPSVSITGGPGAGSTISDPSPSFSFAASEPGSSFECSVDGGAFAGCSSPRALNSVGEGPHTFEVRATDPAGNTGPPAARSFTVDTVAPGVSITSGPGEGSTVSPAAASFGFTSDDPSAGFLCSVDGSVAAACSPPRSLPGLADGPHSVTVAAIDPAGNRSAPASRRFTVDGTGPSVRFTGGPARGSTIAAHDATFEFIADEPGSSLACSVDDGAFAPCSSPLALRALADGPHALSVRATDPAGNVGPVAILAFAVDTTPPAAPGFSETPNDPTTDPLAVFGLTGEEGATFECRLDDGRWSRCPENLRFPSLALGHHVLDVRQVDPAGNVSQATRFAWDIVEYTDPSDPHHCALQAFRVRATASGLRIVMRSEVPRLVKIQVFRRSGPFAAQRRLSVYRKRSTRKRTVRLIRSSNFGASRKLRRYAAQNHGRGLVTRIVPRVINEVRGCNEGGQVGARIEPGYVSRFTRRLPLGLAVQRAWRLHP